MRVGSRSAVLSAILLAVATGETAECQVRISTTDPAQIGQRTVSRSRTLVVEVLMQPLPLYRVRAQEWGRVLQELGYAPRFRAPEPGEKMRIEQQQRAGRSVVVVVGGMTPSGAITIGNRDYSVTDKAELEKLLKNLQESGSEEPGKDPRWGLTEQQFAQLRELLRPPLTGSVKLSTPGVTLRALGLPRSLPVTWSEGAFEWSLKPAPKNAPAEIELTDVSRGTAIAIILAQYGLGFRPVLTRSGFALEVVAGGEGDNLWPIGWKTEEQTADLVPRYLRSLPFAVEDADVEVVIETIADHLEIPSFYSTASLSAGGVTPADLLYSRDGKISPFRMLREMGEKLGLGFSVRADEAGRVFLWVTTADESAVFAKRFAHVRENR